MKLCRKLPAALTIDELFAQAVDVSAALAEDLHRGRDTRHSFTELAVLLESLPLAQGEFAWTIFRLGNAVEYVAQNERQAAAWEIRQLNRRLVTLNNIGTHSAAERRP
jgi:hypothetical protein